MFRLKKIVAVLSLTFLFLLIINSLNSRAIYTENITIDCELDTDYRIVSETDNYTVYHANSESLNFIFIAFNFNISGKNLEISSGEFFYDISPVEVQTNFLHSKHDNQTLELSISRASIGDTVEISIVELDLHIIMVSSASKPSDPIPDEEEEEKDEDEKEEQVNETVNPFGVFASWYDKFITPNAFWLWIPTSFLLTMISVFFVRYFVKPVVFVRENTTETLKDKKLGRFVECYQAGKPLDKYWVHVYKNNGGIKKYYHVENFESFRRWLETTKLPPFEKYAGHILPIELELPEHLRPVMKQRVKGEFANWFKYWFIYRFACFFIPSGWLGNKLSNIVKYETVVDKKTGEPVKQKTITLLVHEATMKYITTVVDIKYKYRTYSSGKEVIETKKETGVPLYLVKAIKRDKNYIKKSLKMKGEPYTETRSHTNPAEALKNIVSKAEIMSIHELEVQELTKDLQNAKKETFEANERVRKMKAKIFEHVDKALKERENASILSGKDSVMKMIAEALNIYDITGKEWVAVQEAVVKAIKEYYGKVNSEIVTENAQLKAKIEILEENLDTFRDLIRKNGDHKQIIVESQFKPRSDNLEEE